MWYENILDCISFPLHIVFDIDLTLNYSNVLGWEEQIHVKVHRSQHCTSLNHWFTAFVQKDLLSVTIS